MRAGAEGVTASPMALELVRFKQSLDTGPAGAVLNGTDPVPQRHIYRDSSARSRKVISNVDSMQRFASYPGTRALSHESAHHRRCSETPHVARQVTKRDFVGLLGNPKIVAAVNDPSLEMLVRNFELEKALDYALTANSSKQKRD